MGAIHADNFTEALYKVIQRGYFLRDSEVKYSDDKTERLYDLWRRKLVGDKHEKLATFRARALPGCCGVLVVYYLRPTQVGSAAKIFNLTFELIRKAAGKAKFGAVLLTQTRPSTGEGILDAKTGGFRSMFTNWKTRNEISTFLFLTEDVDPPKKAATFGSE